MLSYFSNFTTFFEVVIDSVAFETFSPVFVFGVGPLTDSNTNFDTRSFRVCCLPSSSRTSPIQLALLFNYQFVKVFSIIVQNDNKKPVSVYLYNLNKSIYLVL